VLAQATDLEVLDGAVGGVEPEPLGDLGRCAALGKGLVSDMVRSDLVAVGGS